MEDKKALDCCDRAWSGRMNFAEIKYVHIEDWCNRPLQGERCPYIYVDGIYLRCNWSGEFENAAILVVIAFNTVDKRMQSLQKHRFILQQCGLRCITSCDESAAFGPSQTTPCSGMPLRIPRFRHTRSSRRVWCFPAHDW